MSPFASTYPIVTAIPLELQCQDQDQEENSVSVTPSTAQQIIPKSTKLHQNPKAKTEIYTAISNQHNRLQRLQSRISAIQSQRPSFKASNDSKTTTGRNGMNAYVNEGKDQEGEEVFDHRIPVLDMKILQIQLGMVRRIEEFLGIDTEIGANFNPVLENVSWSSSCRFYDEMNDCNGGDVGDDEIEYKKGKEEEVFRDVVLRWRRCEGESSGEDFDAVRRELNIVVERWLRLGFERDGEVKEDGDGIKPYSGDCGRIAVPFNFDLEDWEVI